MTDETAFIDCSKREVDVQSGEVRTVENDVSTGWRVLERGVDPADATSRYMDTNAEDVTQCYHILDVHKGEEYPTKRLLGDSYTVLRKGGEIRIEPSRDVHLQ